MKSYSVFISQFNHFQAGRDFLMLLQTVIPNEEDVTAFLTMDNLERKPLSFLVCNRILIVDGVLDFYNEKPNVSFTVRNKENIVQKHCHLSSVFKQFGIMHGFHEISLQVTFNDGSQLTLNNVDYMNAQAFRETVQFFLS